MNKEKSHPEVSKESAAAKSPDNQEQGPQHTQIKTETVINEIVTGEKRTATSPKKQTAEQKDNNTTDRGTDAFTQGKASFFPKFSTFSGDEPKQRRESSFEEWQYEVLCCLKDGVHSHQAIGQAIRKSLIGQASPSDESSSGCDAASCISCEMSVSKLLLVWSCPISWASTVSSSVG